MSIVWRGGIALVGVALWFHSAAASPFGGLVVFGDSLSDIGNISSATAGFVPGSTYWNGRFSNGPVYAESLATGLGLPPLARSTNGGGDFAYGGAQTTGTGGLDGFFISDVDEQVTSFLSSRTTSATTLYVVFAGANDLIGGQTNMSVPGNSLATSINRLVNAGARQFLVINLPPLGDTPRFNNNASSRATYNARAQQYNTALATMVAGLHTSNPAVTTYQFDLFALMSRVITDPAGFGLANVSSSAAPGLSPGASSYDSSKIVANPNQYLFWDDLHPTTAVHAVFAQRLLDLFRLPGDFNSDGSVDAADYVRWRNGASPSHIPDDYNVWREHVGQAAGAGTGRAMVGQFPVPESTTDIVLSLILLYSLCGLRTNRTSLCSA